MNIKNINGALFAMALVAASAGFTSCEDEPDKYEVAGGTPTIDYVLSTIPSVLWVEI